MASSILTMCVAAYFYLQTIVYFQTYMSALLILIPVTSTLFVKIPWAHTRVHVKLVMREMETHVTVR